MNDNVDQWYVVTGSMLFPKLWTLEVIYCRIVYLFCFKNALQSLPFSYIHPNMEYAWAEFVYLVSNDLVCSRVDKYFFWLNL